MAFLFWHLILHRGVRFLSLVVVVLVLLGGRRVAEVTWLLGVNQGVKSEAEVLQFSQPSDKACSAQYVSSFQSH
jgi:hypothetical protein